MAINKTKPSKSRVKPKAGASAKALKTKTAQTELPKTLTTRVFKSGNSQAVRIPKEFQFEVEEVEIFKQGNEVVLRPKIRSLAEAFKLLTQVSDDFFAEGRYDPPPQQRESLDDL